MKNRLLLFLFGILVITGIYIVSQKPETGVNKIKQATESGVPLLREEDVIRVFFGLIDEGRVSEAVMMMAPEAIEDDSNKQAWGVMWNAFEEMKVISLAPAGENIFKVVLETKMKPEAGLAQPMPYYGYGDGQFTRWVEIEKVGGVWKIKGLATGP
jgi:hypothetical protein